MRLAVNISSYYETLQGIKCGPLQRPAIKLRQKIFTSQQNYPNKQAKMPDEEILEKYINFYLKQASCLGFSLGTMR